MVKTKQQKSKPPKKNSHVKKQGKQADISKFRAQLEVLYLKIIQVTADGNCFFRCLADQLEGDEEQHGKFRNMVVQYIRKNRERFEPFIEDDVPFDEYCQSMEKDGTWAGHMELQAASLVTHCNICIHRYMSPRWYIHNFDQSRARMVHLSYHDEEHYNSVRSMEDSCEGPARPIIIKADAELSATSHQAKNVVGKTNRVATKDNVDTGSIKLVMAGSGCQDAEKVKQVLLQVDGDIDAAIEFMVAEQEIEDYAAENDSFLCHKDTSYETEGDDNNGNSEQHQEETVKKNKKHDPTNNRIKHDDSSGQAVDKKISRNKVCPCGSKKKYKACCGTTKGKLSTKFSVNQTVDSKKVAKERKQSKNRGSTESHKSNDGMPDMGALCI